MSHDIYFPPSRFVNKHSINLLLLQPSALWQFKNPCGPPVKRLTCIRQTCRKRLRWFFVKKKKKTSGFNCERKTLSLIVSASGGSSNFNRALLYFCFCYPPWRLNGVHAGPIGIIPSVSLQRRTPAAASRCRHSFWLVSPTRFLSLTPVLCLADGTCPCSPSSSWCAAATPGSSAWPTEGWATRSDGARRVSFRNAAWRVFSDSVGDTAACVPPNEY